MISTPDRKTAVALINEAVTAGARRVMFRFLGRHGVRLSEAWSCLASEKRQSGKSRGWFWAGQSGLWVFERVCCFGSGV